MAKRKKSRKGSGSSRKEEYRRRMEEGEKRSKGSFKTYLLPTLPEGFKLWNCGEGDHLIDILEYKAGDKDPIARKDQFTHGCQTAVHKNVGPTEQQYVCPAENYKERCPICEDRNVKRKDNKTSKDEWKKLFPSKRVMYNILCHDSRKEVKEGVQVFEVAHFYMERHLIKLSKKILRPGQDESKIDPYIYFQHPTAEEGKSISFSVEPAKSEDSYITFEGHKFEERDYDIEDKYLKQCWVLDQYLYVPKYDEIYENYFIDKKERKESGLDDLRDDLEEMDMNELEEFIDEHDLDLDIQDYDDEDEAIEDIIDEMESKQKKSKMKKIKKTSVDSCPEGFTFGKDYDTEDECDECEEECYEACLKANKQGGTKRKSGTKRKKRSLR